MKKTTNKINNVKIKLTKLSDDEFKGEHPNGIYAGYVVEGYMVESPKVGHRFEVITAGLFSTSIVTKINNDGTFKTMYSTYKLQILT